MNLRIDQKDKELERLKRELLEIRTQFSGVETYRSQIQQLQLQYIFSLYLYIYIYIYIKEIIQY